MDSEKTSHKVFEKNSEKPFERTSLKVSEKESQGASERRKISSLAERVMGLARDDILMHLRFFQLALAKLEYWEQWGLGGFATDGNTLCYDPVHVLGCYRENPKSVLRACLHMLLHCVFLHGFRYDKLEKERWDLAADIAVESVILELGYGGVALEQDGLAAGKLRELKERMGALTAERIYRHFGQNPPEPREERELRRLFDRDIHSLWKPQESLEMTLDQWKKISERVRTRLRSFTGSKSGTAGLEQNLEETVKERYDYGEILRRFTVSAEEIRLSEEEFDYIYYTYGLEHYGNLPLIEPLEYRESTKVREFVIAIDTSASCSGRAVAAFLRKTCSILKTRESFFEKINVHILQCDAQVRSDTKVTGEEDLEEFLRKGKLTGFGATDFRPVFDYVETLRERREFENLKGLIYFTDGYGIYPEKMPDYQVIFAFLEEDENRPPVPPWSMKAVLEEEMLLGT